MGKGSNETLPIQRSQEQCVYLCQVENTLSNLSLVVTSAQVRKQLAEVERVAAKLGEIFAHDVSLSTFIHVGLELEEYQYVQCVFVAIFLMFLIGEI